MNDVLEERKAPTIRIDQKGCARCDGEGHRGMVFKRLTHPVERNGEITYTHWAPCPANGEPILLEITATE